MRYKCQIIVLLLFIATSCKHRNIIEGNITVIQANANNKAKISQLFSSVEIIPLETHSSGLMGLMFFRIETFRDRIYFLNQLPSHINILCFDNEGHYLFTLDRKGNGPEEYTYLGDVFINRRNEQLVLNTGNRTHHYFDLDGQFLFKQQSEDTYFSQRMYSYNDSVYYAFNNQRTNPTGYDLLTIDPETMNIVEKSLSRSPLSGILFPILPVSIHDGHVLLYDATDTIFDVTNITDRKANYFVDFGSSHRESILYLLRRLKTLSYDEILKQLGGFIVEKKLSAVTSFFENDSFLSIGYIESTGGQSVERIIIKNSFLLYNKNTRQAYNSNNIEFDVLNLENMGDISILGQNNNALYAIYTPDWSDENKKKMLQSKFLTEKLRKYISQGDDENNPVLVVLRDGK
jgi:hypothetical protein